jgi:uncharacterized SAM-dependent methyltransferase
MQIKQKIGKSEKNSEINDLIFKELLKRGYSLEGNTRIWNLADSKLWYLTPEQAQGYLDLDKTELYKENTDQKQGEELVKSNLDEILDRIKEDKVNIIDLGCGNGEKAAFLISLLSQKLKVRYCPIDISAHMVRKAIETVSKLPIEEVIEFQWNISDFENLENVAPLLKKGDFKRNVFLILGNTIGNFDIHEILYQIRSAMNSGDLLIIDAARDDKKHEERAKHYRESKDFDEWMSAVPMQLGLSREDLEFGVRFKTPRLEVYYTINKDKVIHFQNKTLQFFKGDQIIILTAYKYLEEDLTSFFYMYFDDVVFKKSKTSAKILAICKK